VFLAVVPFRIEPRPWHSKPRVTPRDRVQDLMRLIRASCNHRVRTLRPLPVTRRHIDSHSVSMYVRGGEKSRACLGIKMHYSIGKLLHGLNVLKKWRTASLHPIGDRREVRCSAGNDALFGLHRYNTNRKMLRRQPFFNNNRAKIISNVA